MTLCCLTPAIAQVSINFSTPGVNIGINLPVYPQLQRVPGYPVYYAPSVSSNYFFYDGLYWVYESDNWYESSWYNGPWRLVEPDYVPVYLLRVPVRYYRRAPVYFRGWRPNDPPRWGEHWGQTWTQRRSGWDQWNRSSAPAPAPLPSYQRQYSGNRYPQASQQAVIQTQNYRFQPSDRVAQQHFQQQRTQAQSAQPVQAAPPPRQTPTQRQQQQPQQQPQVMPQPPGQPRQTPAAREQQAPPQRGERQPQPAPAAREQQGQPQRGERPPQPVPSAPQQQGQPQRGERQPQAAPAAREQQAPRPQATENAPPGRDQGRGKDSKDPKDKDDKSDRGRDR
jgi:hypothetical protein